MPSLSVSSLDGLGPSKNKMHPQNKMPGSDPFYFHFIFIFLILKGAPAPPFYFCTPDGGARVGHPTHSITTWLRDMINYDSLPREIWVQICVVPCNQNAIIMRAATLATKSVLTAFGLSPQNSCTWSGVVSSRKQRQKHPLLFLCCTWLRNRHRLKLTLTT